MVRSLLPLVALLLAACQTPVPGQAAAPARPDEVVVAFEPDLPAAERVALREAWAAGPEVRLTPDMTWFPARPGALAALTGAPGVRFAAPNGVRRLPVMGAPAPWLGFSSVQGSGFSSVRGSGFALAQASGDPLAQRQWHLDKARFPAAWATSTGEGVTVAVIDSGVDPDHPDLAPHLLPLVDEVTAFGRHDRIGGTSYDGRDGNGHGTHVAGLVGALRNNGVGVTGGAPDATILPVKVTAYDGETDDATIAKGITDAVAKGARVLNLSIGGPEPSQILLEALNVAFKRGCAVAIAAGNDGGAVNYPAAYAGVLSVGSETATGDVAGFSSRGEHLVVLAPGGGSVGAGEGTQILSTVPTYDCYMTSRGKPTAYAEQAGTSMASPLVSALAALVMAADPALTGPQVRTRIAAAARDMGAPGWDADTGWGSIDAGATLQP